MLHDDLSPKQWCGNPYHFLQEVHPVGTIWAVGDDYAIAQATAAIAYAVLHSRQGLPLRIPAAGLCWTDALTGAESVAICGWN